MLLFYLGLNLNGIRRQEPILAIIYDEVCVHMLLSVWAADQAAEISCGLTLDLQLVKLVLVNYCFYKIWILKLFSVGCRYYETSGVVGC